MEREPGFTTRAVRWDTDPGDARPVSVPIYQTATYAFEDPEVMADLIRRGKDAGFVYTRWHNPTRDALEKVVADLEGAERGVSFASGMAAITTTLAALVQAGDEVVTSPDLYGGSHSVMSRILPRWGVDVTFAASHRAEDVLGATGERTKAVYAETIGNPRMSVPDLEVLGRGCRERGIPLVVDNTFASPFLCNPLGLGASVVVHSTTKYLSGHSDLIGGIAVGDRASLEPIREMSIDLGGTAAPFDAWLTLRGIHTLELRMRRHCSTALALAQMLENHPKVTRVWYPGLPSHEDHPVARKLLRGPSGMLSFEVDGGLEAGRRFQQALEVAMVAPSLGGTHTLVVHAASVTHTQLTPEQRAEAGIGEGFVRVSVGIEDARDVLADFDRALEKA
ncbi:MAG: aminotransferase class I/II-fold pyridoxal phosphate-dependent enzyme [Actinomycetota bacterium]